MEDSQMDSVLDLRGVKHVQIDYDVLSDTKHFSKIYEKMVYVILCKYANWTTKQAYPSVKRIAEECFCSESSVRSALRKLEELGLVKTESQYNDEGKQKSNLYILLKVPEYFKQ